ncbi:MAG: hypothetical protein RR482_09250, partial [Clostridia bacterium]
RLYYSYAVVNAENPGLNYNANAFASMYADATEKTVELEAHHLPQGSTVTYTLLSSSDGSYMLGGNTETVVTIGAPYTFAFEKKAYMGSMGQEVSMNLTCAQYNNLPATGVALEVWLMDGNGKKSLLKTVQYTRTPVNTVKIAMPYDQSSAQRIQIGLYLDGTLTDTTQVDLGTPTVAIGFASGQMSAHMQDGYIYLKLACTPGVTQGYSRNLLVSGYYTVGTGGGTSGGGWDGGWNWGWNWGNNNATSSGSTNISDRIAFASMVDGKSTEVIKIPIGAFKANDRITFTLDASLNGSYVLGNVRACTVSIVAPPTFGLARKDVTVSEGDEYSLADYLHQWQRDYQRWTNAYPLCRWCPSGHGNIFAGKRQPVCNQRDSAEPGCKRTKLYNSLEGSYGYCNHCPDERDGCCQGNRQRRHGNWRKQYRWKWWLVE